jgi:hypothetical protein
MIKINIKIKDDKHLRIKRVLTTTYVLSNHR